MYEIKVCETLHAAHFLRSYRGHPEPLHGHSWKVEVVVVGEQLDREGVLIDFEDFRARLRELLAPFDHRCLNEVQPFDTLNPTAENLARHVFERLAEGLAEGRRLDRVSVWETPEGAATYRAGVKEE